MEAIEISDHPTNIIMCLECGVTNSSVNQLLNLWNQKSHKIKGT